MESWTPAAEGAGYELTPTLAALAPHRDRFSVLSGLACVPSPGPSGRRARQGEHALPDRRVAADERDVARRRRLGRSDARARSRPAHAAGLARAGHRVGRDGRRLRRRLRLRLHEHDLLAQRRTRRCRPRTTRASVFERLFGDSGSTDPKARRARIEQDRSVLDSVIAGSRRACKGSLGPGDGAKLVEYLDAIRDVERRIQRAEEQSGARAARSSIIRPACPTASTITSG